MCIIANTIDKGGFEFNSTLEISNVLINTSSFLVYPNPFSNSTTISTTTELKNASLKIYSILGQGIKRINNISGREIKLNKGNLIGGVYFYEFTQENKVISKGKLIV